MVKSVAVITFALISVLVVVSRADEPYHDPYNDPVSERKNRGKAKFCGTCNYTPDSGYMERICPG